jgi:hypothetical protein
LAENYSFGFVPNEPNKLWGKDSRVFAGMVGVVYLEFWKWTVWVVGYFFQNVIFCCFNDKKDFKRCLHFVNFQAFTVY